MSKKLVKLPKNLVKLSKKLVKLPKNLVKLPKNLVKLSKNLVKLSKNLVKLPPYNIIIKKEDNNNEEEELVVVDFDVLSVLWEAPAAVRVSPPYHLSVNPIVIGFGYSALASLSLIASPRVATTRKGLLRQHFHILTAGLSSVALAKKEASCPPKRAARRKMAKVVPTFSSSAPLLLLAPPGFPLLPIEARWANMV